MMDMTRGSDLSTAVKRRTKIVIGHPYLGFGGSEAIVLWLIEALKRDHDVAVVTTGGWNLAALNAYYGTNIRENDVELRLVPIPFVVGNRSAAALRGACYQRFARRIAGQYDVRISAYNPTDWGLPAVHFIADFSWHREIRERYDPPSPGFIYSDSILRKTYLGLAAACARPSGRDVLRDDVLIANSRWTASLIKKECGVDCAAILYPPVWSTFPAVAWQDKELAFVMIGRVAPEKRIEQAIAILESVRRRGHAVRLHICGRIPNDGYGQSISKLCALHREWIVAEGMVTGERKSKLLASCRFGIQVRHAEPFGISVAEMVKAGAIVFAPDNGGQAEILDDPNLLFGSIDDAVEKISDVLSSEEKQVTLRRHLARRVELFGAEKFMEQSVAIVAALLPGQELANMQTK